MAKKRQPVFAALLSLLVFAGAGQIYNKEYLKGVVLILACGILLGVGMKPMVTGYMNYLQTAVEVESVDLAKFSAQPLPKPDLFLTGLMTALWLFSAWDAHRSAKIYNQGLPPQP